MKKILLFSFIGLWANANAQITITTADVATPTKVIMQATDTTPTISVGTPGTGLTWNFSSLGTDKVDTITFRPFSAAPNPSFSGANLAIQQGTQNLYSYLINSASSLLNMGAAGIVDAFGSPTPYKATNSPAEKLVVFPMTYSNNFVSDYVSTVHPMPVSIPFGPFTIDSIRSKSTVHKTMLVDSWGALTTPLGTYNSLRAKEIMIKHDTSDAYIGALGGWQNGIDIKADSSANYVWWANSIGFPIAQARMDSLGNVRTVEWLQVLPMTVGINEYTFVTTVNVYPNPAQHQVNFTTDTKIAKTIEVYDLTGRKIDSFAVTSDISTIKTSGYANGSYIYELTGKDNSVLNRGKFTVSK
jgi:hypothetical protein